MTRIGRGVASWISAAALGFGNTVGCGKAESTSLGGETHPLASCTNDAGCDPGLSCLCGVCTMACDADAARSGAGSTARCRRNNQHRSPATAGAATPSACARSEGSATAGPNGALIMRQRHDEQNDCFNGEQLAGYIAAAGSEPLACAEE